MISNRPKTSSPSLFIAPAPPALPTVRAIVTAALLEDTGRGDITSEACIPIDAEARAVFMAREPLVFSGGLILKEVFSALGARVEVELLVQDGELIEKGEAIARVSGNARALLLGERVALNLVQRMSGIATMTRRYVDALPKGSKTRIADTRKTTPLLRPLERYAVRCGGGFNHRDDLSSAILIKDNHIEAAGSVKAAIERAIAYAPHTSRIECEVDTEEELKEAVEAGAEIVLLDNFGDEAVERAVAAYGGKVILEVSGGVTLPRIQKLGELGVDIISSGALTHSVKAADIGLDFEG